MDVISVIPTLSQRYRDADGWMVIAPDVESHYSGRAPDAMVAILHQKMASIHIQRDLQRFFWNEVAGKLADPFVRQQRYWLGQPETWAPVNDDGTEDLFVQKRPVITFDRGSGEILKKILGDSLALVVGGEKGEPYRGFLDYYGSWDLTLLTAGDGDLPPVLGNSSYDLPMQYYTVIDAILRFMRPTGKMLAGGPRLSQARFEPGEFHCRLEPQDFGAGADGSIGELSAHQRIALVSRLVSTLMGIGLPEDQATALIDHL